MPNRSFDSFASHWIIEKLNTTNKSGFAEQDSFELVVQKNLLYYGSPFDEISGNSSNEFTNNNKLSFIF